MKQKPQSKPRSNQSKNAKSTQASLSKDGKTPINKSAALKARSSVKGTITGTQAGTFRLSKASSPAIASRSSLADSDLRNTESIVDVLGTPRKRFVPSDNEKGISTNQISSRFSETIQNVSTHPPVINHSDDRPTQWETYTPRKKSRPVEPSFEEPESFDDESPDSILVHERGGMPPFLLSQKYFGSRPR